MRQVRAATPADVPRILEIYNDAVLHTTATYDLKPVSLASRMTWFEGRAAVLVVETDGAVVAFGSLSPYRERAGYRFTLEHSLYVDAAARGAGVGRLLLEALVSAARERGAHTLLGGVDAANAASLRLHESCGFAVAGHLREVGHKFGRWLDVVFMQKML